MIAGVSTNICKKNYPCAEILFNIYIYICFESLSLPLEMR